MLVGLNLREIVTLWYPACISELREESTMFRNSILSFTLASSMLVGAVLPVAAQAETYHRSHHTYRQRARRKTIKRVGGGAAAGAVVGALAGGGKGAAIGAAVGGGAGYVYDRHKKNEGKP